MSEQVEHEGPSEPQPPPKTAKAVAKTFATAAPATEDLAAQIASQVERLPADRVSCRRISESYYRRNWWARGDPSHYDNPKMGGLTVTTHRVRRSAFLRVVKSRDGLAIDVVDAIDGRLTNDDNGDHQR
jgi:hypothetical protein